MSDACRPGTSGAQQPGIRLKRAMRRKRKRKLLKLLQKYRSLYSRDPSGEMFLTLQKITNAQQNPSVSSSTESPEVLSDDAVSSSSCSSQTTITESPRIQLSDESANSDDNDSECCFSDRRKVYNIDDIKEDELKNEDGSNNENNVWNEQAGNDICENDDFFFSNHGFLGQSDEDRASMSDTSHTQDDGSIANDDEITTRADGTERMEESEDDGGLSDKPGEMFSLQSAGSLMRRAIMRGNLSQNEILAMINAISMRHQLTYQATLAMCKMMKYLMINSALPTTSASLWKALLRNDQFGMERHWYCRICRTNIGQGTEPTMECLCQKSGPGKDERSLSYFIHVKLKPQLQNLFSTPGITDSLLYRYKRERKNPDSIEDIYDGKLYRKKCKPGRFLSSKYNYSFTLNTDGCKLSNSSNASAWPILLTINELPPAARKRHMLLAGIWVDVKHPDLNDLMWPTCNELRSLYETGIDWCPDNKNIVTSRFVTLICTVDSVARPAVLNMTQYNGKYGCTICEAPGEVIEHRRVYRNADCRARTDAEMRNYMRQASRTNVKTFGIKGHSTMAILQEYNLALGTIVEAMHNVFLGVAKRHTMLLLFESANNCWFRGGRRQLESINSRLRKIKTPGRVSRDPRDINTAKNWKASEWRNWLLYYCGFCLKDIIRLEDHEHLMLLSEAAYILNKDSISNAEIHQVRSLLKDYATKFQEIFGIRHMSFNIHLLSHLTDTVENWGPIWAHSAFPFESFNKKIIDSVKSPKARPLQITTRILMNRFVESLIHDPEIPRRTRIEIHSLMQRGKKKSVPLFHIPGRGGSTDFIPVGKTHEGPLSDWETLIMQSAVYRPAKVSFFKRAVIKGNEYRCRGDNETTLFCNKYVHLKSIGFAEILVIVGFSHNGNNIYGLFVERLDDLGNAYGPQHMRNVVPTSARVFVTIDEIEAPVIMISKCNSQCAIKMPNTWEAD